MTMTPSQSAAITKAIEDHPELTASDAYAMQRAIEEQFATVLICGDPDDWELIETVQLLSNAWRDYMHACMNLNDAQEICRQGFAGRMQRIENDQ